MCVQIPCVYILHTASAVTVRNTYKYSLFLLAPPPMSSPISDWSSWSIQFRICPHEVFPFLIGYHKVFQVFIGPSWGTTPPFWLILVRCSYFWLVIVRYHHIYDRSLWFFARDPSKRFYVLYVLPDDLIRIICLLLVNNLWKAYNFPTLCRRAARGGRGESGGMIRTSVLPSRISQALLTLYFKERSISSCLF